MLPLLPLLQLLLLLLLLMLCLGSSLRRLASPLPQTGFLGLWGEAAQSLVAPLAFLWPPWVCWMRPSLRPLISPSPYRWQEQSGRAPTSLCSSSSSTRIRTVALRQAEKGHSCRPSLTCIQAAPLAAPLAAVEAVAPYWLRQRHRRKRRGFSCTPLPDLLWLLRLLLLRTLFLLGAVQHVSHRCRSPPQSCWGEAEEGRDR